ncbi:MAG: TetR/AcrR family transcriptional regulator [Syntrophobacter sp.]
MKNEQESTRDRIIDVAENLFWEKGYHGASMRTVADACHCRPGNLYNYFKSKEELLYEVFTRQMETILPHIKPLANDTRNSPTERMRRLIKVHLNVIMNASKGYFFDSESKHLSARYRKKIIKMRDVYDKTLRKIIREGIEIGEFSETDENLAAIYISSIIVRCKIWYSPDGKLTLDELAESILEFCLNGLKSQGQRE